MSNLNDSWMMETRSRQTRRISLFPIRIISVSRKQLGFRVPSVMHDCKG